MSLPITGCPDFDIAPPRPRGDAVVRAVDFGLSEASDRNQDAINAALAEARHIGAVRVELAPGTYRCFDGQGSIRIDGFEDFVFDGCGATLVFRREHEPTDSQHALLEGVANIEIRNCRRTVVEHFQMDWDWETDPLAFWCVAAEKHVDEADNASYVDFDLDQPHPRCPEPVPVQLLNPMRADRTGPILRRGRPGRAFCGTIIGHTGAKSEWISPTRLRVWAFVRPERGHVAPSQERVYSPKLNRAWAEAVELGTTFAIAHRYYGLNGIVLDSNEDFTLRDVDIWACWGMGVETRGSQTRWQLERVNVRPKPGCKYPVTSTADAHHVVQSRGYGRMVDCEVTMNQDDFLNLHDRTTVGRTVAPRAVEIVNSRGIEYTLLRAGSLVGLKNEDFSDTGWAGRIERIEGETVFFDRDLPPQKGRVFVVYDHEMATENFLFRNCWFHDSPGSRGVVQGRHITFEGCVFGPMKGTPLKLHSCYTYNVWCEGIGCEDVVVRGCRFENAIDEDLALVPPTQIYAGLSIPGDGYWTMPYIPIANAEFAAQAEADRAAGRKVAPSPEGVCRILIEGNTFVNPPGWIFYAKNGSEFIMRDNAVEWNEPPAGRLPFAGQCWGVQPMSPNTSKCTTAREAPCRSTPACCSTLAVTPMRHKGLLGWRYDARCNYMVTLVTEPRAAVFGSLREWGVERNEAGRAVYDAWQAVERRFPGVRATYNAIMPDHFHGIVYVMKEGVATLEEIVAFFAAESERRIGRRVWCNLWRETICLARGQLHRQINYVLSNARRRWIRDNNPGLFTKTMGFRHWRLDRAEATLADMPEADHWDFRTFSHDGGGTDREFWDIETGEEITKPRKANRMQRAFDEQRAEDDKEATPAARRLTWTAMGNPFLLETPLLISVRISTATPQAALADLMVKLGEKAERGAVLVGPWISTGEKMVKAEAIARGGRIVQLLPEGMGHYWKPGGSDFGLCAEGRMLLLSPFAPRKAGAPRENYGKPRFEWLNLASRAIADLASGFSRSQL